MRTASCPGTQIPPCPEAADAVTGALSCRVEVRRITVHLTRVGSSQCIPSAVADSVRPVQAAKRNLPAGAHEDSAVPITASDLNFWSRCQSAGLSSALTGVAATVSSRVTGGRARVLLRLVRAQGRSLPCRLQYRTAQKPGRARSANCGRASGSRRCPGPTSRSSPSRPSACR